MKKEQKKYKIISMDGSKISECGGVLNIRTEDGKVAPDVFEGYLDRSLETIRLSTAYKKHRKAFSLPFSFFPTERERIESDDRLEGYTVGLINLTFRFTDKKTDSEEGKEPITTTAIRTRLYKEGFDCDGVHYVRYKRSAGSSREGHCLFIPAVLYDEMMAWSSCGIDEAAIADKASYEAYIALTLSSIESTITLSKKNILILPDKYSVFDADAVAVEKGADRQLVATRRKVRVKNRIWDGEALLDESVFASSGYAKKGMMLLRNRFFKTCAFNTKLQQWFADNGITDIKQLAGCHRRGAKLSDIKLVITESSLKYCKMSAETTLQKRFDAWINAVFEGNTSDFGVVKTEKSTDLMGGRMVYTNYQMLNTLGLSKEETAGFLKDSFDYLLNILKDPMYMRYYISLFGRGESDAEGAAPSCATYRAKAVLEMLLRSEEFANTKFYRDFRDNIRSSFRNRLRRGRVQVDGTYATLFGNGAEFLRALIDKDYEPDEPLALKGNEIRTTQFPFEKDLLCARSPHITMGNLFLARNVDDEVYKKYFNFEDAHEIVCINAIRHNIQQRLNGCDYDSDTMLVTDNPFLLDAARRDAGCFPVPVADLGEESSEPSTEGDPAERKAMLDYTIANNSIGEIVNLSQFLNSLYWDQFHKNGGDHEDPALKALYEDICKLAVLSGIEIDRAKRPIDVNTGSVLAKMYQRKKKYTDAHDGKLPTFYVFLTSKKDTSSDARLETTMQYVYDLVHDLPRQQKGTAAVGLADLIDLPLCRPDSNDSKYKKKIIDVVQAASNKIKEANIKARTQYGKDPRQLSELMEKEYVKAIEAASDNLKNDHILELLLKELDGADEVTSYYALLFSAVLFERGRRYVGLVRQHSGPRYDLRLAPGSAAEIRIYGYPHEMILR